jgi:hypothetical protein
MRSLIIIVLLLPSLFIKAQITISNLSLNDTTQNILYIGVENLIKISGNYDPVSERFVIMGAGGVGQKKENGLYIIKVQKQTDDCQIWITKNNKLVFRKIFRVRNLGFPPQASINGYKDTTITLSQFLTDPALQISIPDCLYRLNFSVSSYKASIIHGKENTNITVSKNKMTKEQLQLLNDLEAGDEIFFDEIIASTGNFQSIKCLPFKIIIEKP